MANAIDQTRRRFLRGAVKQPRLPRLPWSVPEEQFLNGCQQCNKCSEVCETQIIKRDKQGFPFVDFDHDECTFCHKCIDICPADIFVTDKSQKPWPGIFSINQQCLATQQIYCQSCRDACDSKAITFHYVNSAIPTPKLNTEQCNQCGACVSVCPQDAISFIKL